MRPSAAPYRIRGWERPLPPDWFHRPTTTVARDLLGCRFVHRTSHGDLAGTIVETEAYVGHDPASHTFRGRTLRNRSMFGPPGTLYVYRIHQVHCANVVTRLGQAVLLRALAPLSPGLGDASGPGRLCRALAIGREQDGLLVGASPVRVLPGSHPPFVVRSPRVGISRAAERPLRFTWPGHPFVSRPRPKILGRWTALSIPRGRARASR
jgi:DNA-3-methyladenine glycosylase